MAKEMDSASVLEHIEESELVELTSKMVMIDSVNPPGDELAVAEFLKESLESMGLRAHVQSFDGSRANLVCRLAGSGERPPLVFSGHLDTVPFGTEAWQKPPLSGAIAEGKIFGRGAADMKGGVAAMVAAAGALQKAAAPLRGDLVLALTAGEEVNQVGALRLIDQGLLAGAGGLLIAEPTGLDVCVAEKGALWLDAATYGKAAHASAPHLGKNAILPMADFVQRLQGLRMDWVEHPLLGSPTLNVGTIEGGFKTNVVPDLCRLTLDFRTVPGQEHRRIIDGVSSLLRDCAERAGVGWEVRCITDRPPVDTSPDEPLVQELLKATSDVLGRRSAVKGASYFTDGAIFVPALGVPMVVCGPGEAACAHQKDEWVEIEKLTLAARIYALLAVRLLCL